MNPTSQPHQSQPQTKSGHTFSAKEKDDETGYSYFGARYYDSELSVWLGVDPLADKYPSVSGYMYVLGNPIKLTDPNGMWVEGEGFWRNVFKSDQRIKAENKVTELGKAGIIADISKGKNGSWQVGYESTERVDFDNGNKTFNVTTIESFDKKDNSSGFVFYTEGKTSRSEETKKSRFFTMKNISVFFDGVLKYFNGSLPSNTPEKVVGGVKKFHEAVKEYESNKGLDPEEKIPIPFTRDGFNGEKVKGTVNGFRKDSIKISKKYNR